MSTPSTLQSNAAPSGKEAASGEEPMAAGLLTEIQATPTPVQQKAVTTKNLKPVTTDSKANVNSDRKQLKVEPRRNKPGTIRYDNYAIASKHIFREDVEFNSATFQSPVSSGNVLATDLGRFNWYVPGTNTVTVGETFVISLEGTGDNTGPGDSTIWWRDMEGVNCTGDLQPGSYSADLVDLTAGGYNLEPVHFTYDIRLSNGILIYKNMISDLLHCIKTFGPPANFNFLQDASSDPDFVEPEKLFLARDLHQILRNTNIADVMDRYEAYSIRNMTLDIIDTSNYLKANTAILAYYVKDPARFVHMEASRLGNTLSYEPHLQDVKLFKAGSSMTWEVPVSDQKFFTKTSNEIRFYSPGYLGLVPLIVKDSYFQFKITLTVEVDFYCQTLTSKTSEFVGYIIADLTPSENFMIHQDSTQGQPYVLVAANTGLQGGNLIPRETMIYRMFMEGVSIIASPSSCEIVDSDTVKLVFPTLRYFNLDFLAGIQAQLETVVVDNQDFYVSAAYKTPALLNK
jgi:hypothetical protein